MGVLNTGHLVDRPASLARRKFLAVGAFRITPVATVLAAAKVEECADHAGPPAAPASRKDSCDESLVLCPSVPFELSPFSPFDNHLCAVSGLAFDGQAGADGLGPLPHDPQTQPIRGDAVCVESAPVINDG